MNNQYQDTINFEPHEEWEIARGGNFLQIWLAGKYMPGKTPYLSYEFGKVAEVELPNVGKLDISHDDAIEQMMPRAHMIKAAPGLLFACEEMLRELRAWQGETEHDTDDYMFYFFDLLKTHI